MRGHSGEGLNPSALVQLTIRLLDEADRQPMEDLLASEHMRPEGLLLPGTCCWGAFDSARLVGLIGLEYQDGSGLLRSAIVHPAYRGRGLGRRLLETLRADARRRGLNCLYLFTDKAGAYWLKHGFRPVPSAEVAAALPAAAQVILFAQLGWLPDEEGYKLEL
jgi:amino-acid N-acetyltransferase